MIGGGKLKRSWLLFLPSLVCDLFRPMPPKQNGNACRRPSDFAAGAGAWATSLLTMFLWPACLWSACLWLSVFWYSVLCLPCGSIASAASAGPDEASVLDWLAGFDRSRLENLSRHPNADEIARLIYRIKRLDRDRFGGGVEISNRDALPDLGQWVSLSGIVESVKKVMVTQRLREPLGIDAVYEVAIAPAEIAGQSRDRRWRLFCGEIPARIQTGDEVSATAIIISDTQTPSDTGSRSAGVFATDSLSWRPVSMPLAGWRSLDQAGFDLASVDFISSRDRQPLLGADADSFYAMMDSAANCDTDPDALVNVDRGDVVELLVDAKSSVGARVRFRVEVVSVTRIAIEDARRRASFRSDHYYQCDALAILDKREVVIRRPGGSAEDDILVGDRFPVSIVSKIKPPGIGDDIVTPVNGPMLVDGFFYRTWSYQNDLTKTSGLRQYAPLICAAELSVPPLGRLSAAADVRWIGYAAALSLVLGIAAAGVATWRWSISDRRIRRSRYREKMRADDEADDFGDFRGI